MQKKIKLGVLGSGSGSNMQAIMDAIDAGSLNAEIVLVLSDFPEVYILERARQAGLRAEVIDCEGYKTKFPESSQRQIASKLKEAGVDIVCLAGFMRLVKLPMLDVFPDRILNIHPSLLPAYPGLMAWKQAVDDRAEESGCTVHHVDAGMDTGPIIMQSRVPVFPEDDAASLHARIQIAEHSLYPRAIAHLAVELKLQE